MVAQPSSGRPTFHGSICTAPKRKRTSLNLSTLAPNLSTLAGKVPSSVPFGWRELAWAQAKKLESTDGREKKKTSTRQNRPQLATEVHYTALQHVTHPAALKWGKVNAQTKSKSGMSVCGTAPD